MSEVEGDEEQFVPGTDEEERCLVSMGGKKRGSSQVGERATHWIIVVEPEDTANVGRDELVRF